MMSNLNLKLWLKVLFIGVVTTLFRIIEELIIPEMAALTLHPSIFSEKGAFPIIFIVYNVLYYTITASLFITIKDKIKGNKIRKGLEYGICLGVICTLYLCEPLTHATNIAAIYYYIANFFPLIVLGILVGAILCTDENNYNKILHRNITFRTIDYPSINIFMIHSVAIFFTIGHIIGYFVFGMYSQVNVQMLISLMWTLLTGIVAGMTMSYFSTFLVSDINNFLWTKIKFVLILGMVIFGINALLFNYLLILMFKINIVSLSVRTFIDVIGIIVGVGISSSKIDVKCEYCWK